MKIPVGPSLVKALKLLVTAGQHVLLCGAHGLGKSETVAEVARALGRRLVTTDLSLLADVCDLVGLPIVDRKAQTTRYAPPSFLPRTEDGPTIWLAEELGRCRPEIRAPFLQILTTGRLNEYVLPADCVIIATNNSSGELAYETSQLDPALLSRFAVLEVGPPTVEAWLEWARSRKLHEAVTTHVEAAVEIFSDPNASPRSWAYVSKLVQAAEATGAERDALLMGLTGLVGKKQAVAFMATLSAEERPLQAGEILDQGSSVARVDLWRQRGRIDLIKASLARTLRYLISRAGKASMTPDRTARLAAFLGRLPADLQAQALEFLEERAPSILAELEVAS
jgi:hypothetical protein